MRIAHPFAKTTLIAALISCVLGGRHALADFSGTPTTIQTDGGWCWFQDPRAIIVNGHLVVGTVAGTTVSGVSTGGDEKVTDYNLATGALNNFNLKAAYNQDDHASPAFTVLPDNRVLVTYNSHGGDNYVYWRVSTNAGDGIAWGAEQQSTVNTANDGNANTYSNPWYLSVPNTTYSFSRAIGYDTNYSKFTGISPTNNAGMTNAANFSYGGHFQYWQNPNASGNGRPYVKYTSNGTDTIWLATTEDSPQNYLNSLYVGCVKFDGAGAGTVYTSTGTAMGAISTGTTPTGSVNPPTSGGNQGAIASGTGYSYQPYQFTPIAKANAVVNNFDLSSSSPYGAGYAAWGSSMCLDNTGNPYLGFVVMRNTTMAYGNNLEYAYARLVGGSWKVSRIGYAGYALYSGQDQYAGLIAVDPFDPNKVYFSANVNPQTKADLLGPDGNRHWQIFKGVTTDGGTTWSFTQLTNTSSENIRPIIASGGGQEVLLWMRGTYTSYTNYNTNVVALVPTVSVPVISIATPVNNSTIVSGTNTNLHLSAVVTETGFAGSLAVQWSSVSGPANAVFANATSADTTVQFPLTGTYVLQISSSDGTLATTAQLTVTVNAATADSQPTLWLKLDDSSGTSATDSSGNGLNATLTGGATWQPAGGVFGGALAFDGTSGYATLPEASGAASMFDNTGAFTLSYWFRTNSLATTQGLAAKRDAIATNNDYTTYLQTDGRINVDINTNNDRFTSNTIFTAGKWYHVALVFDGTQAAASRAKLYVNGILDKTASESSTSIPDDPSSLKLGIANTGNAYLNGKLDDVRFYRKALSATEIAAIAGAATKVPSVSCGTAPAATSGVAAILNGTANDNGGSAMTLLWSKTSGPGGVSFVAPQNASTSVTFSQAGNYALRLTGSNAAGEVIDEINVTVAPNANVYADWINISYPYISDTSIIGTDSDPDHDGIRNVIEWALGMNPSQPDAIAATATKPGLPTQSIESVSSSNYLSLRIRRPAGRLGVTYSAEVSGNLNAWTTAVQVGTPTTNADGSETIVFRDTAPQSGNIRRFIRLKITQP